MRALTPTLCPSGIMVHTIRINPSKVNGLHNQLIILIPGFYLNTRKFSPPTGDSGGRTNRRTDGQKD